MQMSKIIDINPYKIFVATIDNPEIPGAAFNPYLRNRNIYKFNIKKGAIFILEIENKNSISRNYFENVMKNYIKNRNIYHYKKCKVIIKELVNDRIWYKKSYTLNAALTKLKIMRCEPLLKNKYHKSNFFINKYFRHHLQNS